VIGERRDAARERRAASAVDAIDRRIAAYTEILYGARSLSALGPLTLGRYHAYIDRLDIARRYPGIQVTTFSTAVPAAGLAAFRRELAADIRRSGLPYPPFRLTPPGPRRDHVIIGMIEPQRGNERAFGFDLLAESTRRATVERARDTGSAAATGPIRLIQETGEQRGLIIMLPVYRPQAPIATVPERRRAFVGVQTAAFRVGDLMRGVLGPRGRGRAPRDLRPGGRPRHADDRAAGRRPLLRAWP
jgi:CHASE1-domain containing sensor protein